MVEVNADLGDGTLSQSEVRDAMRNALSRPSDPNLTEAEAFAQFAKDMARGMGTPIPDEFIAAGVMMGALSGAISTTEPVHKTRAARDGLHPEFTGV